MMCKRYVLFINVAAVCSKISLQVILLLLFFKFRVCVYLYKRHGSRLYYI